MARTRMTGVPSRRGRGSGWGCAGVVAVGAGVIATGAGVIAMGARVVTVGAGVGRSGVRRGRVEGANWGWIGGFFGLGGRIRPEIGRNGGDPVRGGGDSGMDRSWGDNDRSWGDNDGSWGDSDGNWGDSDGSWGGSDRSLDPCPAGGSCGAGGWEEPENSGDDGGPRMGARRLHPVGLGEATHLAEVGEEGALVEGSRGARQQPRPRGRQFQAAHGVRRRRPAAGTGGVRAPGAARRTGRPRGAFRGRSPSRRLGAAVLRLQLPEEAGHLAEAVLLDEGFERGAQFSRLHRATIRSRTSCVRQRSASSSDLSGDCGTAPTRQVRLRQDRETRVPVFPRAHFATEARAKEFIRRYARPQDSGDLIRADVSNLSEDIL